MPRPWRSGSTATGPRCECGWAGSYLAQADIQRPSRGAAHPAIQPQQTRESTTHDSLSPFGVLADGGDLQWIVTHGSRREECSNFQLLADYLPYRDPVEARHGRSPPLAVRIAQRYACGERSQGLFPAIHSNRGPTSASPDRRVGRRARARVPRPWWRRCRRSARTRSRPCRTGTSRPSRNRSARCTRWHKTLGWPYTTHRQRDQEGERAQPLGP